MPNCQSIAIREKNGARPGGTERTPFSYSPRADTTTHPARGVSYFEPTRSNTFKALSSSSCERSALTTVWL
jgi:hypothetical protein